MAFHRTEREVVHSTLWRAPGRYPLPECLRDAAIAQVLMRLPRDAWQRLEGLANKFRWFVPRTSENGGLLRCPLTEKGDETHEGYAGVLYLSPLLEDHSHGLVIAVVVHELAHLSLDHWVVIGTPEDEKRELEAWQLVKEWGFEEEARLHPKWPGE